MKINLFISYYKDKNLEREKELQYCLTKNAENALIDRIIHLHKRPTYQDMFEAMQPYPDDINIIANTDIYFDETIGLLKEIDWSPFKERPEQDQFLYPCLALTRWNQMPDGRVEPFNNIGSQDVWIIKGCPYSLLGANTNFFLGQAGCDNRIACVLKENGYYPYNPSESIRAIHVHNSNIRNYSRQDVILGRHMFVSQTNIHSMYKETQHFYREEENLIQQLKEEGITPKEYKVGETIEIQLLPKIESVRFALPEIKYNNDAVKAKPRLLHIALCAGENGLTKQMKAKTEYLEIDWGSIIRTHGVEALQKDIIKSVTEFKPDLVFMQLQNEGIVSIDTVKEISQYTTVINWTGDKREALPTYLKELAPYCVTGVVCEEDVSGLTSLGFEAKFMQIGYDPEIYNPLKKEKDKGHDIVFNASNYGHFPLSGFRETIAGVLKANYLNQFGLYGSGWSFPSLGYTGDNQHAEAIVNASSKIGINISHFNTDRYTSDRIFRLMGSGVMVLSHNYKGIEKDFVIGEHLDVFNDYKDLIEKCNYYLANPAKREIIAFKGQKYASEKFTFEKMVDNILEVYYQKQTVLN